MFSWFKNKEHKVIHPAGRILRARFDAAQTTADNARHWANADSLSADGAANVDVRRKLRERSRYEVANNSYAKGIILTIANDCIGTGPRLQLLTDSPEINRRVETEFKAPDYAASFNSLYFLGTPSTNNEIKYRRGQWKLLYYGNWWVNTTDFTVAMCNNKSYSPPKNIHPAPNEWVLYNSCWELSTDYSLYHHWDFNGGRRIWGYHSSSEVNPRSREIGWWNSYEELPRQTDPKEQLSPVQFLDTKKVMWQIADKVAFERDLITTPETMGAIYPAWDIGEYWSVNEYTFFLTRLDPFTGVGNVLGSQYHNGDGWPQGSCIEGDTYDGFSRDGCRKVGSSYQAMIERTCQFGMLPVDADYMANWEMTHPQGTESDDDYELRRPNYDSVGTQHWGCNQSGFELYLKQRGIHDWYFDTEYPWMPMTQAACRFMADNYTTNKTLADYPAPIGTWRRTWRNTLGRIRPLIRPFEMGTPIMGNYPKAQPQLQPVIYNPWDYAAALQGVYNVTWPTGCFVSTMPTLNDFFETVKPIQQVMPVALTGRRAWVSIQGDYRYVAEIPATPAATGTPAQPAVPARGIKKANVVIVGNDVNRYIECYVMTEVQYDPETNLTWMELDKDVQGFQFLCHDSRVSARHDPVQVDYKLVRNEWVARPQYQITAALMNEMRELLHGITFERISVELDIRTTSGYGAGFSMPEFAPLVQTNRALAISQQINDPEQLGGGTIVWRAGDEYIGRWKPFTLPQVPEYITGAYGGATGPATLASAIVKSFVRATSDCTYVANAAYCKMKVQHTYHTSAYSFEVVENVQSFSLGVNGGWVVFEGAFSTLFTEVDSAYNPFLIARSDNSYLALQVAFDTFVQRYHFIQAPDWVWNRDLTGAIEPRYTLVDDIKPPTPDDLQQRVLPQAYFKYYPPQFKYDVNGEIVRETTAPYNIVLLPEYWELRAGVECCLAEDLEGSNPVYYQAKIDTPNAAANTEAEWTTSRNLDWLLKTYTLAEVDIDIPFIPTACTDMGGGTTRITLDTRGIIKVGDEISFWSTAYSNSGVWKSYTVTAAAATYLEFSEATFVPRVFDANSRITLNGEVRGYDLEQWKLEPYYECDVRVRSKDNNSPIQNVGEWSTTTLKLQAPPKWPFELKDNLMGLLEPSQA